MFDKIFKGLWEMIKVYDLTSITSLFSKKEMEYIRILVCDQYIPPPPFLLDKNNIFWGYF